ncbi:MAG TPA: winged helix-turn-helix domain-containing protein [Candidatus Angelobacter sp.]
MKYKFDDFEADLKAAELRKNGNRLKLQLQPFQVLVALLERPREVLSREELRLLLWPEDTFVDFDHGLNTAMAKLRDVLGDSATNPRYIETIAKRGYRFLGEVSAIQEQARALAGPPGPVVKPAETPQIESATHETTTTTRDEELPRASRRTVRFLFTLSQVMYLIFYLSALFRLDRLEQSTDLVWQGAGHVMFVIYLTTALVGLVMRLYLITATAFDYHLLGEKYRILFPILLLLDMLWALSPFLIFNRIGLGLALGASATLIYMPFAQRVLMKMMAKSN